MVERVRLEGIPQSQRVGNRYHNLERDEVLPAWRYVAFVFRTRPPIPPDLQQRVVFSAACDLRGGPREGLSAAWLGHACFFVRFPNGFCVVTDPVLEARAGPFGLFGPRRLTPPGATWAALREAADLVVISHSHYDHLSARAMKELGGLPWAVPKGLGPLLESRGVGRVTELDWGEAAPLEGAGGAVLTAACLPCQHWSRRTLSDRNTSLWASWSLRAGGASVFFGGDTGYAGVFKTLGERAGPFDLALIGIGAYAPAELMKCHHASPEEAVQMHVDLRARRSVGMHWGTWALAAEPLLEPPARLAAAVAAAGLPAEDFVTVQVGRWFSVPFGSSSAAKT